MMPMPDAPDRHSPVAEAILAILAIGGFVATTTVEPRAPRAPVTEVRTAGDQVVAHRVLSSVADDLPALEQLEAVRYAELPLRPETTACP